jgi:hypothetical protein
MKEEIYKKLLIIQNSLSVPKGQHNDFGNYDYRSCEDILEVAKPVAKENKCLITLSDEVVDVGGWNYVKATASLIDTEDGNCISVSAYAREPESRPKFDSSQLTGSASSYARKYSLNGLLALDDTKDADSLKPESDKPKAQLEKEDTLKAFLDKVETGRGVISKDNYKKCLEKYKVDSADKILPHLRQEFIDYMREFKG